MPRTHNATGRSLTKGNFAQVPECVMHSPAYLFAPLPARAILFELALLYRGTNNGHLGLSCRQAAARLQCSKDTAAKAFKELLQRGLVERVAKGRFTDKTQPLASVWRLPWRHCDRTGAVASHAYRKWAANENYRSDLRDATVRREGRAST
jgi:hypothetical protein